MKEHTSKINTSGKGRENYQIQWTLFVWGVFLCKQIKTEASSKGNNFVHEEMLCSA